MPSYPLRAMVAEWTEESSNNVVTLLKRRCRLSLRRPYHRVITGEPVEGYLGEVPELPGCVTAGETAEEALGNLDEAMAVWIESALAHGDPIPEPAEGPARLSA